MDIIREQLNIIRDHIGNGNLEEAISAFSKFENQHLSQKNIKSLIVFKSRFSGIVNDFMLGLITIETKRVAITLLNTNLLDFLFKIENDLTNSKTKEGSRGKI